MNKKEHYFAKVGEYKARFRKLADEEIRQRLDNHGENLFKEARVALREILEERKKK